MSNEPYRIIIPPWVWIIGIISLVSVSIYVMMSVQLTEFGFPLDDAWIHQTYARNLATFGEWSFLPGEPSAGSTSPMWTILLSLFYNLSDSIPFVITFILGWMCVWGSACIAELFLRESVLIKSNFPFAGSFIALEWHLVWAGASGMETGLTSLIILLALWSIKKKNTVGFVLGGLLAGIGVWVRPDAITVLGPVMLIMLATIIGWKTKQKIFLLTLGFFLIPFIGYLAFNYSLSGQIWPNTFYAKQAEYALLRQTPILERFTKLASLPLVGAGALLLPGVIYKFVRSIQKKDWYWLVFLFWWLGYTMMYAVNLPVTYQHGRYLIPAMPVFFVIGMVGSVEFIYWQTSHTRLNRIIKKSWGISIIAVLLFFLVLGTHAYSTDVAIINTEMVATAKWIEQNTRATDLIAVHDIGAVGYFSHRKIIDLAGLVTPEIVPIIRDEDGLIVYLNRHQVDYLVTFPGWYNQLSDHKTVVFQSDGLFSPIAGGENMTVYRWMQP